MHDVFVLPTQFEGSPVSLLETMSAGLVPVITDLPGGIREIVEPAVGFRLPMGDKGVLLLPFKHWPTTGHCCSK